jgi:acyl-CoA thioesterase FadM
MQEARTSYMRRKLLPELAARGEKLAPTVVAESTVEYLAPIFYSERVVVHLGIAAVGNSYFTFRYEIVKRPPADVAAAGKGEATPCGRGTARLVCIDPQTQKKANLTPSLRRLLEAGAEQCAAGSTPPATSASATAAAAAAAEPATAKPATPSDEFEEWPLCWVHEVEYRDLDVNVHANNCAVYCTRSFDAW